MANGFSVELETITVACRDGVVEVPGVGRVAHVSIFDKKTYKGPSADLIVDDVDRLEAVIEGLRGDSAAQSRALETTVAETLKLCEVQRHDGMFAPSAEDEQRRRDALAWAFARFPLVQARMKEVYGLRLPRHLAVYAAFDRSLSPFERLGRQKVGRAPWGIMIWFDENGLDRKTRDGLDPRLQSRFRQDPPELVTVMGGDTDGLHYGLWFDDPAELPSFVASNYARDSAETSADEATVLAELREQMRRRLEERDYPDEPEHLSVHAFIAALEWFQEADEKALAEDGSPRGAEAERGDILGGMGPALKPSHGNPRDTYREYEARYEAYKAREHQPIVDEARRELAAGKPAYALVVGRELHWFDDDDTRADSLELLTRAYEALGRHALAEIARVHHAHRDLESVAVYE
jgi:hypothetical protein